MDPEDAIWRFSNRRVRWDATACALHTSAHTCKSPHTLLRKALRSDPSRDSFAPIGDEYGVQTINPVNPACDRPDESPPSNLVNSCGGSSALKEAWLRWRLLATVDVTAARSEPPSALLSALPADNRQQTTHNRQQTTDNRQQTTDSRQQTAGALLPAGRPAHT